MSRYFQARGIATPLRSARKPAGPLIGGPALGEAC